jgi:hypothetical protein
MSNVDGNPPTKMSENYSEPKQGSVTESNVFDLEAAVAEVKIALLQARKEKALKNTEELRKLVVQELANLELQEPGATAKLEYGRRMEKEVLLLMAQLKARGNACTNYNGRLFTSNENPRPHCVLLIARQGDELPSSILNWCNLL